MDRIIEKASVSLWQTLSRRGFLGKGFRALVAAGLGAAALASGGPAYAACSWLGGHQDSCSGTPCSLPNNGRQCSVCDVGANCGGSCHITAVWYCCCTHTQYKCVDCECT